MSSILGVDQLVLLIPQFWSMCINILYVCYLKYLLGVEVLHTKQGLWGWCLPPHSPFYKVARITVYDVEQSLDLVPVWGILLQDI